jgi:hypothetical protein
MIYDDILQIIINIFSAIAGIGFGAIIWMIVILICDYL